MAAVSLTMAAKAALQAAISLGKDKETGGFDLGALLTKVIVGVLVALALIIALIVYLISLPFGFILDFVLPNEISYENVFPENIYYEKLGAYPMPCDSDVINSPFGSRDSPMSPGSGENHSGIDFAASHYSPVVAIADGTVKFTGYKSSYGRCVVVEYDEFTAYYAHLAKSYATRGAKVSNGMVLGTVGGNPEKDSLAGDSTGAHLHFETRVNGIAVDPAKFILIKETEETNEAAELPSTNEQA